MNTTLKTLTLITTGLVVCVVVGRVNKLIWKLKKEKYQLQIDVSELQDLISANDETFARAWLSGYEVEEEPLYYALIKGHELVNDEGEWSTKYWNLWVSEGCVFPHDKSETTDDFSIIMSKEDWNKYGINDLNADFIKVEDEEK